MRHITLDLKFRCMSSIFTVSPLFCRKRSSLNVYVRHTISPLVSTSAARLEMRSYASITRRMLEKCPNRDDNGPKELDAHAMPIENISLDEVAIESVCTTTIPGSESQNIINSSPSQRNDSFEAETEVVKSIDGFAKSRVQNCMLRQAALVVKKQHSMGDSDHVIKQQQGSPLKGSKNFPISFSTTISDTGRFKSILPITFVRPHSTHCDSGDVIESLAIGYGDSRLDAEAAAAVHAERILDASGVQVCSLASLQIRHADAAKAAGRLAPYPAGHPDERTTLELILLKCKEGSNMPLPVSTHSKIPSFVASSPVAPKVRSGNFKHNTATAQHPMNAPDLIINLDGDNDDERLIGTPHTKNLDWRQPWRYPPNILGDKMRDETEGGFFWLVELGPEYYHPSMAIWSPHVLCPASLPRVKSYFKRHGKKWKPHESLHKARKGYGGALRAQFLVHTVRIPGLKTKDSVIATGIARDAQIAELLCAMHAELLIDYFDGALFGEDNARQNQHADEVWSCGRYALPAEFVPEDVPERIKARHQRPPKPLREWMESYRENRRDVSRKSLLTKRVSPRTMEESFISNHHGLVGPLRIHVCDCHPDDATPELVNDLRQFCIDQGHVHENLPMVFQYHLQWRTTFILPVPTKFGLRGSYAVTTTQEQGIRFAARHAVEILCWLGIPLYKDKEKQLQFEQQRRAQGLLVRPRDLDTGELIQADPKIRSPPSLRLYGDPGPFVPHLILNGMLNYDGHNFCVDDVGGADGESRSVNSEMRSQDIADFIRPTVDEYYSLRCGLPQRPQPYWYSGLQYAGGLFRAPCHTCAMPFPLGDVQGRAECIRLHTCMTEAEFIAELHAKRKSLGFETDDRQELSDQQLLKLRQERRKMARFLPLPDPRAKLKEKITDCHGQGGSIPDPRPNERAGGVQAFLNFEDGGTWILAQGRGRNRKFAERNLILHAFCLLAVVGDIDNIGKAFPPHKCNVIQEKYRAIEAQLSKDGRCETMCQPLFLSPNPPNGLLAPRPIMDAFIAQKIEMPGFTGFAPSQHDPQRNHRRR